MLPSLSSLVQVTVKFLVQFTNEYDCWDMTAWQVVENIIRPLTEPHGRCAVRTNVDACACYCVLGQNLKGRDEEDLFTVDVGGLADQVYVSGRCGMYAGAVRSGS